MEYPQSQRFYGALIVLALAGTLIVSANAQDLRLQSKAEIAGGLHLWYEVKADPEDPKEVMICGTKWDAMANAPFGVVYASSDSGSTWEGVLEDRTSLWVTEHSCAWGRNHKAYLVSEASKIIDGQPHHEMGTTRLFVSTDALKHWTETIKTGWADYSTSAVESSSGRLYVFFNATGRRQSSTHGSSTLGLLVFSPDGSRVAGPFFCPEMLGLDYHGVYPADAIALKNGGVAALYHGTLRTVAGLEGEIGLIRADKATSPSIKHTRISRFRIDKDCLNFDDGALAYDQQQDRLFVVYAEGCKNTRILLTSSDDHGRTWSGNTVLAEYDHANSRVQFPSLVAESDGRLGLLWSGGPSRWLFTQILNNKQLGPPTELSAGPASEGVNPNSLWTIVSRGTFQTGNATNLGEPITVEVRSLANSVWRTLGLVVTGDNVLAIWPSLNTDGNQLNAGVLGSLAPPSSQAALVDSKEPAEVDVTRHTAIDYDGRQSFDSSTGTLTLCLALRNQGTYTLRRPIRLQATGIESPACAVSILNATNGRSGPGAIWDISDLVTGDRIPAGATSNPFCLSIQVDVGQRCKWRFEGEDLLVLKMRVLASGAGSPE